ncbi:MAG: twin-arginine translocase TatA/TatE family subunit [Chloroflexi bacterium]|nr:twin-arginine translocase TatA/TatE family subunit [Chloroflexota bacterium]MCI0900439.1 twin-arginine translocase TatA/TatE family subunit [Chloroflexota bacterium]MCI0903167.1 twin-arginine translocase TatA/TatE family subunit [Chloroflexota bacterium]
MNFMGMGIPELGVIMLVAFLVLGPSRTIDMARKAGKVLGDLRRSFGDVTSAMSMEALENMDQRTTAQNQKPDTPMEPPPGVPTRAEIPPEDEQREDNPEAPSAADTEPTPSAEDSADVVHRTEPGETG